MGQICLLRKSNPVSVIQVNQSQGGRHWEGQKWHHRTEEHWEICAERRLDNPHSYGDTDKCWKAQDSFCCFSSILSTLPPLYPLILPTAIILTLQDLSASTYYPVPRGCLGTSAPQSTLGKEEKGILLLLFTMNRRIPNGKGEYEKVWTSLV